jgi:hypothetical protein
MSAHAGDLTSTFDQDLALLDPEVAERIDAELRRQQDGLDIVAETLVAGATAGPGGVDPSVLSALGARVRALASAHPLCPGLVPLTAGR